MTAVQDRRGLIADAALTVLATAGARGLTHRAVDATAGLPLGSTSYYYRSRAALLIAAAERLANLDLADGAEPLDPGDDRKTAPIEPTQSLLVPSSVDQLAEALADSVLAQITTHRDRTLARYHLSLEAESHPAVAATLDDLGQRFTVAATSLLTRIGSTEPAVDARALIAVCAGLVFESTVGAQLPYSRAEIRAVLADLLRARTPHR